MRFGKIGPRRLFTDLPYDAEVEYLESDGNGEHNGPYIDTGIYPRNNPSAIIRCQYLGTNLSAATTPLFGSREYYAYSDKGNCAFGFWIRSNTMKLAINYDKIDTGWLSQMTDTTSFHDFKLSNEGAYYDGVQIYTTKLSIGSVPRKTVFIFALNQINYDTGLIEHITRGVKLRVASFQLFTNGVLSWDGICVRKDGIGYMYDRVSGKLFGNQGTGNFILGPDKKNVSLPYDSEVEYLESTGTQWIDTGVVFNTQSALNMTLAFTRFSTSVDNAEHNGFVKGNDSGNYRTIIGLNPDKLYAFAASIEKGRPVDLLKHDFEVDYVSKVVRIDTYTSQITDVLSGSFTHSFYMFARNTNGTPNLFCEEKMYKARFYSNSILIRDFIPVRFTNEHGVSEGAMYDRVSGKLFRNQGSGTFIIGPDKVSSMGGGKIIV